MRDPEILNPRDAIVRVTLAAICGSDLHLYNGLIPTRRRGDRGCGRCATTRTQTHVPRYTAPLLARIEQGEIDPSRVITHRVGIDDVPAAFRAFRDQEDGCVKYSSSRTEGCRAGATRTATTRSH